METSGPVLNRRRTLTNSAAEFVEARGGLTTLHQLLDTPGDIKEFYDDAEFVPEIDRFAPRGVKLKYLVLFITFLPTSDTDIALQFSTPSRNPPWRHFVT